MAVTAFQRPGLWSEPELRTPAFMLFDLEVDDAATADIARRVADEQRTGVAINRIVSLRTPSSPFESQLLSDVRRFKRACVEEEGAPDNVVIATKLANIGYTVSLRTAIGGGQGTDCFHHLHHETLRVAGEGSQIGQDFIIDLAFRDQFTISQSTSSYSRLMDALPQEFVGPSTRLAPLVQLMCQEMASAFHHQGAMPPPWRQPKAMLSKWLPSKSRDLLLAASSPTSPSGSEPPFSFRDGTSYLFDSSSPISTLAPWKSAASPAQSSAPWGTPLGQAYEHRKSSDATPRTSGEFKLKSALSLDLAATGARSKPGQAMSSNAARSAPPGGDINKLPGMERIFTVKMRGW